MARVKESNKKENDGPKRTRRGPGFFTYAKNMVVNPIKRGFVLGTIRLFGTIIAFAFVALLLSGVVNQVRTGENIVNYLMGVGQKLSVHIINFIQNEGPIVFTNEGVYFRDAVPPDESLTNLPEPEGDVPKLE